MQEQMGNINRAMEALKRISEFEDRPSSNRNAKRKNDFFFNETEYQGTVKQLQKAKQMWSGNTRRGGKEEGKEREKGKEDIFELIMAEKFSKLMTDTKPQIQRNSETTK